MKNVELVHGLRAGLAVIAVRPRDVVRVAFSRASARLVEPATRELRARGIACRMLGDGELDRLARAPQHEGLCVETRPRKWSTLEEIAEDLARTNGFCVALDRVKNPYNTGAIVRSAAFFGARAMVLGTPAGHVALDAQAVRVAEGGAEHVLLAQTMRLADALVALRKNRVHVVGAEGSAKNAELPARGPLVLVFGNERIGLHERVRAECDDLVAIRGADRIESLNVAVAAGILISIASQNRIGTGTSRSSNVPSPT